ncbi:hypothetical protein M378DRAFT_300179 [Amanita muscaria Koide BX008]|uniref:Uncharacterized protein n=1 Tax=Amanita muscaria (strain Koide BX008) TaxID=946122 RepID=A0A0C2TJU7_AMAMK|nr:hypothetical protein M378DRAFT_300179 [Amanita muscaria Koide BX008]
MCCSRSVQNFRLTTPHVHRSKRPTLSRPFSVRRIYSEKLQNARQALIKKKILSGPECPTRIYDPK